MEKSENVLICPLNWGLGHATRCIPVIRQLLRAGHHVTIAASGRSMVLLNKEFPDCELVEFPDYLISYPAKGNLAIHIIMRFPDIMRRIRREHAELDLIIQKHNINVVISDNRYGLWTKRAHCIFITHQMMIKCPPLLKFMEPILHRIVIKYVRRYNECWIPDNSGKLNLSGDLSHKYRLTANTFYTGWMSRFFENQEYQYLDDAPAKRYDILAIISGPEPQRSYFEDIIIGEMVLTGLKCCIIRGTPEKTISPNTIKNIDFINYADIAFLRILVKNSKYLICRPGYSTLMDLLALKKNAILIPTPGQTEQEYLARYLHSMGWFYYCSQKTLDINNAITESARYKGFAETDMQGKFFSFPEKCIFYRP